MSANEADHSATALLGAEPIVFVTDFPASLAFYTGTLGFEVAFTYGEPPFYGQVRRDAAHLNLRHVDTAVIDPRQASRDDLLSAAIGVRDADALFDEFQRAGARFHQLPRTEPWGARSFIVLDPDNNLILFAGDAT
jgi:catechol 2,3-dioxygenase-like lactoylglutathione lyase family enzyme